MFSRKVTLPIDLDMARHDGEEKLEKLCENGGELSVTAELRKIGSHRYGIIDEAIRQTSNRPKQSRRRYTITKYPPRCLQIGSHEGFSRKKQANGKMDT